MVGDARHGGLPLLGVPLAHLLFRRRFPGRTLLRGIVVAPFVLPTVVVGIAFRRLFTGPLDWTGLDGSAVGIVLALVFFNVAVVVRTVGSFWEGLDPRPAQAAASLGASPWRVARTVTLPALMPVLTSAASVVFLFCATAFGVVLTLGGLQYANVETQIYLLTTQFLDLQGLLLCRFSRWPWSRAAGSHQGGPAAYGTAGLRCRGPAPRLGRTDVPVLALAAVVLVLVLAPVAALMLGSVRSGGEWTLAGWERLLGLGAAADAASDRRAGQVGVRAVGLSSASRWTRRSSRSRWGSSSPGSWRGVRGPWVPWRPARRRRAVYVVVS